MYAQYSFHAEIFARIFHLSLCRVLKCLNSCARQIPAFTRYPGLHAGFVFNFSWILEILIRCNSGYRSGKLLLLHAMCDTFSGENRDNCFSNKNEYDHENTMIYSAAELFFAARKLL